jgi:hypothetical protein
MEVKYAKINHHKVKICENQPPLNSIKFKSAIIKLKDMKMNHHKVEHYLKLAIVRAQISSNQPPHSSN